MLNKLGITSGARMARIFMDLLRDSEFADFSKSMNILAVLAPELTPSLFNILG